MNAAREARLKPPQRRGPVAGGPGKPCPGYRTICATSSSFFVAVTLVTAQVAAQAPSATAIIRSVDAAVADRVNNVLGFTDIEHYAVYRGDDDSHPVAEMTVKDAYTKGVGKSYTILSKTGSSLIFHFGLKPLIENEETINQPGNVEKSWFVSANYDMKLRPGGPVELNGRSCYILDIKAKRRVPNMIDGSMWVDARDGSLAQIDGIATASASSLSGPAHMMRQYRNVEGYSMATHARAESHGMFIGRTVVTIDYSDYHLQLRPMK